MLTRSILSLALLLTFQAVDAADLSAEMKQVEAIRQLRFTGTVSNRTMTREEFPNFIRRQFVSNLPTSEIDYFRSLHVLQLISERSDHLEKLIELYESQVLAFYDPASHTYYSLDRPPAGVVSMAGLDSAVVLHELTHALQDQRYDAGKKLSALGTSWDAQLAYQALLEGDASLVLLASLVQASGQTLEQAVAGEGLLNLISSSSGANQGVPEGIEPYFLETMKLPYLSGLKMIVQTFRRGGWAAVDKLYERKVFSTEALLHPEMLTAEEEKVPSVAVKVRTRLPQRPRRGSRSVLTTTLGEFHWRFLLGDAPAAGWTSDQVQVLDDRMGSLTVLVDSAWDTENDALEFAEAYRGFLESRGLEPRMARRGNVVRVGYGTDRKATTALLR